MQNPLEKEIRRPFLASSVFEYLTLRSWILKDLYSFKGSPSAATGRHRLPQAATGWKTFWPCQGVPLPPDFTVSGGVGGRGGSL